MAKSTLSADHARLIAIEAAGLGPKKPAPIKSASDVLPFLGAVQLDTISTLARSHELVHYARVDASRDDVERALWANPAHTFEYWSHAACVLPLSMYPWFATRRRGFLARKSVWRSLPPTRAINAVKKKLEGNPQSATDLGGAKRGGEWWDWSDTKEALEWLLAIGEVVCTQRIGWRRIYSLSHESIPRELREQPHWQTSNGILGPSDAECIRELILAGVRSLGIGTFGDIVDVHRLGGWHSNRATVTRHLNELVDEGLIKSVDVDSWNEPAYANPSALNSASRKTAGSESTTTLLTPFDSLIWHRDRVSRIFGMDYRIEAYTPAAKRIYGYFAMPVLHDGQLVARVDPGREKNGGKTTLVAKTVTFETDSRGKVAANAIQGTAMALTKAAKWVNATSIECGTVKPESASLALSKALSVKH